MRKAVCSSALIVVLVVPGCSALKKASPAKEFYAVAGSYEVAQIAIDAYVHLPTADPSLKKLLKEIDKRATDAIVLGHKALKESNDDQVQFAIGVLRETLLYLRPILSKNLPSTKETASTEVQP